VTRVHRYVEAALGQRARGDLFVAMVLHNSESPQRFGEYGALAALVRALYRRLVRFDGPVDETSALAFARKSEEVARTAGR
jgi:hypothetical protein